MHNKKPIDEVTQLTVTGEVSFVVEDSDVGIVNNSIKLNTQLREYPDISKPKLFL